MKTISLPSANSLLVLASLPISVLSFGRIFSKNQSKKLIQLLVRVGNIYAKSTNKVQSLAQRHGNIKNININIMPNLILMCP